MHGALVHLSSSALLIDVHGWCPVQLGWTLAAIPQLPLVVSQTNSECIMRYMLFPASADGCAHLSESEGMRIVGQAMARYSN
jgi:hypothetical protein